MLFEMRLQLAIKNMEYKVIDDSAIADTGIEGGDTTDGEEEEASEEVGGFYFGTMAKRRPELAERLKELKESVAAAEGDAGRTAQARGRRPRRRSRCCFRCCCCARALWPGAAPSR